MNWLGILWKAGSLPITLPTKVVLFFLRLFFWPLPIILRYLTNVLVTLLFPSLVMKSFGVLYFFFFTGITVGVIVGLCTAVSAWIIQTVLGISRTPLQTSATDEPFKRSLVREQWQRNLKDHSRNTKETGEAKGVEEAGNNGLATWDTNMFTKHGNSLQHLKQRTGSEAAYGNVMSKLNEHHVKSMHASREKEVRHLRNVIPDYWNNESLYPSGAILSSIDYADTTPISNLYPSTIAEEDESSVLSSEQARPYTTAVSGIEPTQRDRNRPRISSFENKERRLSGLYETRTNINVM
ncbi:hypothetical protein V1511DRAFT_499919 [Dipodascopsis uninucleata]